MAVKIEASEIIARNIKEWNIAIPEQKYMVVIHCSTYNHGKFIEDALKGFIMQQTNFSFCAIIIDDSSTDNNAEIIRRYAEQYPDIIKPICLGYNHMQNGLSRNPYFDLWHKSAKYIAQCEGDDYWIDPLKLQNQVDFLEKNPDFGLVYSTAKIWIENKNKYANYLGGAKIESIDELLIQNKIITNTTCFRSFYLKDVPRKDFWKMGDYPLWLHIMSYSKIHFINKPTSVYRKLEESASHSKDYLKQRAFINSSYEISKYFANKLGKQKIIERINTNYAYNLLLTNIMFDIDDNDIFKIIKKDSLTHKMWLIYMLSKFKFGRRYLRYRWNKCESGAKLDNVESQ